MGHDRLTRIDDVTYRVDDVVFMTDWAAGAPDPDRLRIMKKPHLIEQYATFLGQHRFNRVVEVGVHEGGSTALLTLLGDVEKLVAIELADEPPAALLGFVESRGLSEVVRLHFGTDQSDRARLRTIVADEFGGRPVDLVIDDASHLLGPTTACFETLFPALAPGGVYIVEDWSWQLRVGAGVSQALTSGDGDRLDPAVRQILSDADAAGTVAFERRVLEAMEDPTPEEAAQFTAGFEAALRESSEDELRERARSARDSGRLDRAPGDEPLMAFVVRVLQVVGLSDEVIADVHVDPEWVSITRGPAELDPDTFRLGDIAADSGAPPVPTSDRGE